MGKCILRTIKLTVAYDGSAYKGFQKQPHGNTVQNILEEFLTKVCGEPIVTAGSGRTDAGVHAYGQIISFFTTGRIPCNNIVRAASTMLPEDIVIIKAEEAREGFHARFDAHWKEYRYRICTSSSRSPFLVKYAWQIGEELNIEKMNLAAKVLLGRHDFTAFRSTGSVDNDPIRTIYRAEWLKESQGELSFYIAGDGFLYHMVRNIVWSLVQVGLGKRTAEDFSLELQSNRCEYLNSPAPGSGLYLNCVGYEPYATKL